MKKLIVAAVITAASFGASANVFHSNLQCGKSVVQFSHDDNSGTQMIVDGRPYPFGKEAISIPNMGGGDMVTMLRAANQKGEEAAISFTNSSLRQGKLWLLVGSNKEVECREINSWNDNTPVVTNGSHVDVTYE